MNRWVWPREMSASIVALLPVTVGFCNRRRKSALLPPFAVISSTARRRNAGVLSPSVRRGIGVFTVVNAPPRTLSNEFVTMREAAANPRDVACGSALVATASRFARMRFTTCPTPLEAIAPTPRVATAIAFRISAFSCTHPVMLSRIESLSPSPSIAVRSRDAASRPDWRSVSMIAAKRVSAPETVVR